MNVRQWKRVTHLWLGQRFIILAHPVNLYNLEGGLRAPPTTLSLWAYHLPNPNVTAKRLCMFAHAWYYLYLYLRPALSLAEVNPKCCSSVQTGRILINLVRRYSECSARWEEGSRDSSLVGNSLFFFSKSLCRSLNCNRIPYSKWISFSILIANLH